LRSISIHSDQFSKLGKWTVPTREEFKKLEGSDSYLGLLFDGEIDQGQCETDHLFKINGRNIEANGN
jgi:hypothetical protein